GGERLVVGQHQRGALRVLDKFGDSVGFAGASDAQQNLMFFGVAHPAGELLEGARLVAARPVVAMKTKFHGLPLSGCDFDESESFYYKTQMKTTEDTEDAEVQVDSSLRAMAT